MRGSAAPSITPVTGVAHGVAEGLSQHFHVVAGGLQLRHQRGVETAFKFQ